MSAAQAFPGRLEIAILRETDIHGEMRDARRDYADAQKGTAQD